MKPNELKIGTAYYGVSRQFRCQGCGRRYGGAGALLEHQRKAGHSFALAR